LESVAALATPPYPEDDDAVPEAQQRESSDATGDDRVFDLVIEVIEREPRPMRGRDVWRTLRSEGHDLEYKSVGNSLYYAAHTAKKIRWLARGVYAPLSYEVTELPVPDQNPLGGES
jgi:hypothetical protein